MSGESGGLILIPIAIGALPLVLGGLAVAGVAAAAVKAGQAAVKYEKEQRTRRDEIRRSGVNESIGDLRAEMNRTMEQQSKLNISTSEQMLRELEQQREIMRRTAQKHDISAYSDFAAKLDTSRNETMQIISKAQADFDSGYRREAAKSMERISQSVGSRYSEYMNELHDLRSDSDTRRQRARDIADQYIKEAETLIDSLTTQFDGERFAPRELALLREQLARVKAMYEAGRFETAVAIAKDTSMNAIEEIYNADAARSEWENYYKLALVLSEEVAAFIEGQRVITPEVKAHVENAYGRPLENDIVGISISDYTPRDECGRNTYDLIAERANEIYNALRAEDGKSISTAQLKRYNQVLNNEIYPSAAQCVSRAVINMNNAFSRQNMSEELIDFFEEHNFMFNGYAYENDRHDEALHMGFENEATGEELLITLAPELISNGDIQTHVDIKQIKGDEANEERKAYYRECVEQVVTGNNPYAKVDIKCKNETRGRLSNDTETKKKLKI